jgi:signal transduction histidine kinase
MSVAERVRENRMQFMRLTGYVLLVGVIVVACILAFRITLPAPPPQFRLDRAELSEDGSAWRTVSLPHQDVSGAVQSIYRLSFDYPGKGPDLWSVFLPRFVSQVDIIVNGDAVFSSREAFSTARPDRNIPEIATLPSVLLKAGHNEMTVKLSVRGPLSPFLDPIYVGPDSELRPAYNLRVFLFETLPVVLTAWQAIVGVILLAIWLNRRKEPVYGVLAAAMAAGVLQGLIGMPSQQVPLALLGAAPSLESALMLLFIAVLLGLRLPRFYGLIFLPALALVVLGLLGMQDVLHVVYVLFGPVTVGLCIIAILLLLSWSAIRRDNAISYFLGPAVAAMLTCWMHDLLRVFDLATDDRIFVGRLSYSAALIIIGTWLAWRFVQALNELDSFAGRLVERVRDAEEKLRESFAREEVRSRNEALAAERTRLMRDLHDGLGGHLVSIVALSEQTGTDGARIGEAARAALKDLRLVIDAMDDIDGDLMLVLGSWRERTMAQLRAHGMKLDWHVRGNGIPAFPDLRPWHVIQILRLLDEAVTNAVKHSGASTIKVSLETVLEEGGEPTGRITIEDNGHGFAVPEDDPEAGRDARRGRGLSNMQRRAELCGAQLSISSGKQGTSVRLDLPHRFPATGIAAS